MSLANYTANRLGFATATFWTARRLRVLLRVVLSLTSWVGMLPCLGFREGSRGRPQGGAAAHFSAAAFLVSRTTGRMAACVFAAFVPGLR
jgi:hypothetical protein